MSILTDSYSESNYVDAVIKLDNVGAKATMQSFTGNGKTLDSCKFYLSKTGSPTGNAVAKIYAHSGTFGTNSVPTGSALATSDNLDVSGVTGSFALYTLLFSGANRITLANGTNYCLVIEYTGGDASNYISSAQDSTSPTHAGNRANQNPSNTWFNNSSTRDSIFYIYSVSAKVFTGLAIASVKTALGLAIASVKNKNGLAQ